MGSKLKFTEELIDRICSEIAGGMSIVDISKEEWCPSQPTIYRRMASDESFESRIAFARSAQQDYEADKCVEMADKATNEDWQVVKLRIWARQWRASKLAPKKYGDKIQSEISGKDGGPIETTGIAIYQLPDNGRSSTD